jgi:uncharacterized membrane protein YesL
MAIASELFSVTISQINPTDMQSTSFGMIVRILTLMVLTLLILGMVGLIMVSNEATKSVNEKHREALQAALGTNRYYHALVNIARETEAIESSILRGLNPLLLLITLIVALISLAYILSAYPKPHPLYQLFTPQLLSIWLTVVFLTKRRKTQSGSS